MLYTVVEILAGFQFSRHGGRGIRMTREDAHTDVILDLFDAMRLRLFKRNVYK